MLASTRASDADKATREDRILRPNRNEKRFEKHRNKGKKRRSASLFPFRWVREGISLREQISHKENRQIIFCPFRYGRIGLFRLRAKHAPAKQIISRNCDVSFCLSYFDSKDSLRGSKAINRARLLAMRKNVRCLCDDFCSRTLEKQFVCHESDKFAVGGLFVGCVDFDAENVVDVLDFASVPSNFDCMAYRSLDFRGRGLISCGDAGVELFGDRIDDFRRFDGHFDGFTQELITFDMCRYADGNEKVCDALVQSFVFAHVDLRALDGAWR